MTELEFLKQLKAEIAQLRAQLDLMENLYNEKDYECDLLIEKLKAK
jgi:hypothetical protein